MERDYPNNPHAYVKLWKHGRTQPFAEQINNRNTTLMEHYGHRVSGEGFLAKAAEICELAPSIWHGSAKLMEVGDWIVWQLTGSERRSLDFACFKAMYSDEEGYPAAVVEGLEQKLSEPHRVGRAAGHLSNSWIARCGIRGNPVMSVACIDAHAVLPAVGVTSGSMLVGALGTSSGFLALSGERRVSPPGYGVAAFGAALPDIWCCEAGQAAFGDMLSWLVKSFARTPNVRDDFEWYNMKAEQLAPGCGGLLAIDWFGGNRVPYADMSLSGLLIGLRVGTTAPEIYRAFVESLAFGVRGIFERGQGSGIEIERVILTSSLARNNKFLVQTIADVLARQVEVPDIDGATAMGAAIYAAVAGGVVSSFSEGADRFGCHRSSLFEPIASRASICDRLYQSYVALSADEKIIGIMRQLHSIRDGADEMSRQPGSA